MEESHIIINQPDSANDTIATPNPEGEEDPNLVLGRDVHP